MLVTGFEYPYCCIWLRFILGSELLFWDHCLIYRYNFNKVAQYKQLTLEEAEEKMKNRRKSAEGYQRWMMKVANNGAATFGEVEKIEGRGGGAEGSRRKKGNGDDDEDPALSDKGEEDEEEEMARKNRLGLDRKGGDDDEEGPRGGDLDFDDDDIEKGIYLPFLVAHPEQ